MANPLGNPNLSSGRMRGERNPRGEIGVLIDRLLTEKGWTLRQYAEEAGFLYQQVQAYLKDNRNPTPETLARLLAPFGLDVEVIPQVVRIREIGTNRVLQVLGEATKADEPAAIPENVA